MDTIKNDNDDLLVSGTEGEDSISNSGNNVTINALGGKDRIYNTGNNVTITGGKGNDYVYLHNNTRNTTILYNEGDGNETIYGFNDTSTLDIGGAAYKSAKKIGNEIIDIIITVGNEKITLQNVGNLTKLNIVGNFFDKPLNIFNDKDDNNYLIGSSNNDSIRNLGQNATIFAGAGNDSIYNARTGLIQGEDGNDTIESRGLHVSIDAGDGNDSIRNFSSNVSIYGGAGDDTIRNESYDVTINAGEGNDSIFNSEAGKNVLFRYYEGDGNDTITGFRADSSLNVVNANYTTSKSGNDIIVTVGDEKIILQGAATLSKVNISKAYDSVDKPVNINNRIGKRSLVGGNNDDTIINSGSRVTIAGNDGNDSISNEGLRSIINGGLDDDTISNSAEESTVDGGSGNDSISNTARYSTITGGGGNDSISNSAQYSTITGGGGNDSINNNGDRNKIEGGDGDDSIISNSGNELFIKRYIVTISGGAGNDFIESYSHNSKIFGDAGNDTIKNGGNFGHNVTIEGGAGDDYIEDNVNASGVLFRYNKDDGNDYIVGFQSKSSLELASGVYADTSRSGNDIIATIGENKVTLAGAASLRTINIIESTDNINNTAKGQIITTSKGDDTIKNSGAQVTINSRGGNDSIDNSGYRTTINSKEGNDTISDSGDSVSIDAGAGNDSIYASGSKTTIIGGKGDDSVTNDGKQVVFQYSSGDGNDILYGFYQGSKIFIAEKGYHSKIKGDDMILSVGDGQITIDGAAVVSRPQIENLPVSIKAERQKEIIIGTDAKESVYNNYDYVTVQTNGGDDSIDNTGDSVSIDAGDSNDYIYNGRMGLNYGTAYNATIQAGAGNDTIYNMGARSSIDGGEGNDYIYDGNNGKYSLVTIKGGKGNDTINNNGDPKTTFQYTMGDGNDCITGFRDDSTLDIGGEEYSSVKGYYDIIVTVGDDRITLKGATTLSTVNINGVIKQPLNINNSKDDFSVVGSSYGDIITNSGKNVTIDAQSGGDSISNSADSVTIDSGTGHDTVTNSGSQVSITGGEGKDRIYNSGSQVSITGGAGKDTITNNGSNVTIEGGAFGDVVIIGENGDNALIKYKLGDDGDLIQGFKTNSTLLISGGVPANTETLGNDIIATVGNDKIILQGAAKLSTVNIIETPVNIHNSAVKRYFGGTNANDTIINSGDKATIQGFKGKDSINNNAAYVLINGGAGSDNISNTGKNSTLLGSGGNDSLYNNAARGLVLGSEDNDSIFNHGEKSTILGEGGNDTIENYTNSNRVSIAAGVGNDSIKNAGHNVTIEGGAGNDTVISSTGTANSITGGVGDDFISIKGSYKNTILGGVGNDTISLDWGSNKALIQYTAGDGSDVIEGFNATSTLQIGDGNETYDKAIEGDDVIITVGEENITLNGAAKLSGLHIAGVTQLKVNNIINASSIIGDRLDDSIVNSGHKVTISAVAGNDTVENSGRYVSISGGADNDFISNSNGTFVTIDGADGFDTITATNSNFASVDGGDGNDVISVSGGVRNVITGGAGDDSIYVVESEDILIKHSKGDGNDFITGFNENSTLQIGSETDTYTKTILDGNFIITVGDEKITLAGAENLATVNIIGTEVIAGNNISNSDENVVLNGNAGNDTISNTAHFVTIKGNAGNDTISNAAQNVTIDAGIGNDTINNSSGNVSIDGGEGDDYISNSGSQVSITGGAGSDTISNRGAQSKVIGGRGNDSIYNTGDNATISGKSGDDSITNYYGSNVVFDYVSGDGNDTIWGFDSDSTLNISGLDYATEISGNDVIVTVSGGTGGNITIKDGAKLVKLNQLNIAHVSKEFPQDISNTDNEISVVGTAFDDTIGNKGEYVTINALGGNDTITNEANNSTVDGGEGNDTIVNDYAFYSSIAGGEGSDVISVASSSQVTINAGTGDDTINLSRSNETFIEYTAGDGSDLITGFDEYSTLNIARTEFTSATTDGGDIVITVGNDKITLEGAASLSNPNIVNGTYATFKIKNGAVTCETDIPESFIKDAYQFNATNSLLTVNDSLKDKIVEVNAEDAAKVNWHYGTATLSKASTLEYQLADGENTATLTSNNYDDKITFSEKTMLNYGRIQAEVQENGTVSTKAANHISFENNSSALVTARRDCIIDVAESNITVNDIPINAIGGAGTVTVKRNGLSFEGHSVQFADLEIAKESYFGKLSPMKVDYDSGEETYTVYNTACIKTLSSDFTKLTFDFKTGTQDNTSSDEKYAYYKINDVTILTTKDEENTSVVEVNDRTFKVEDKEIDAEKIGRITLDDKITFSGTEIKYDGVETNYAQNKPVIYSLDEGEISISDAATITTGEETKTFNCEAGSYVINRRAFETTTDLTFTADENEIKIPMRNAKTEIYFDGVKVSGISNGGEIVFEGDKVTIPNGATLSITSPDEVKLNLAAGSYTIDGKKISIDNELEITVDKDNIKIPLSENDVTINGAAITGTGEATIDNTNELFCSVLLPNGALVKNLSGSIYQLTGKDSIAYFGDANKKVQLTGDGTTYIEYYKEDTISVGINRFMFETVEIKDNDTWTIETSGTSGIDKITGITDGATVSTSTEYVEAGDLRFEVETSGAGTFTICGQEITSTAKNTYVVSGNSNNEIKVSPLAEEYKGDDSEAAGKVYNFDKAGDYTVNGITFHAEKGTKAQTITRGVEFNLSTGKFQYDGLTLSGSGTAQINRYNASLISLTDGAKVSGSDATKYQNRQFEILGAVELIGKKFETNQQIRCGLVNIQETIDGQALNLRGFVVDDKYVQIQDECYDGVTVVDKKISRIEGVKASAQISGNGLQNASIVTTQSGEFKIHENTYKISDDSDGVTFVMDSHGNISEINGLAGSVEGNFENTVNINGKTIRLTGASSIKVTSDGEKITEITNVAGDLVTADGKTYRKDVRVYELGGAEKLKTSADGTIIFSGNKFKMSAGKTFELDNSGNVLGLDKAQLETANASANVAENETSTSPLVEENLATINLSTTDELEEVFGDFSEGLTVNGVFVRVTDSTNFVVKDDEENVYIETTAADTFNINGKTFETSADKTIFKLDKDGNVSEIVTDRFYLYPDKEAYLIEGDFSDEIIFNGQKFCVKGTNDTSIFIGEETLIGIELAKNNIKIVGSGGAAEIAVSGEGEITIGDKVLSTSGGFVGSLRGSFEGIVDSVENFVGTIEGKLGGLELNGTTINSEDNFNVTGDGEKITAIENLQNGSVTGDNLDAITINGEKISVDDSDEVTLTITNGKLKTVEEPGDDTEEEFLDKLVKDNSAVVTVNANNRNVTLKGGEVAIVEDTSAKVNVTAGKGQDTIYTSGNNVDIDLKAGGATEIFAAQGRATVENYKATSGAAFLTENENIADAIADNSIAYDDGKLTVNSARVTFAQDADSRIINFVDTAGDLQKVGFVSDDAKLDASKETGSLILVGGNNSTITGGKGKNQIYLEENGESTIALNGKNTIANFNTGFDSGDKVLVDAANHDFSFDGENISVKSGTARATLQSVSSGDDAARILTLIDGKETKTAIAQASAVMSVGDDLADVYYGEKSGVDFSNYENSLTVDLRENFYGINQVTLGGGQNTLISSSTNETLTSSDGTTEFIFSKDSGRDVIQNFNFDDDKINVGTNAVTNVRINSAGGVRMEIGGNAVLTLDDAQGKNFKINEFTALVDENLTYDATANYFVATSNNATLTVNESAEIWLDGSHGKTFSGDIRTLDASTAQGKTSLAGNDLDNTIIAGNGDSSLWGGNGGDDLLVGGTGKNTFYYLQGNGSDTIAGAHDGDEVILSTVTLDQIASTSIAADSVSINFKDGGSLQVNSNANVTYQLADGSKYSANHEQATWIVK